VETAAAQGYGKDIGNGAGAVREQRWAKVNGAQTVLNRGNYAIAMQRPWTEFQLAQWLEAM